MFRNFNVCLNENEKNERLREKNQQNPSGLYEADIKEKRH